ncbi:MAG TPA: cytidyltransferase, partial [Rhodobacterales bacterium]|nr:cytidyltransferase [Rhodobacterales bacterium]
MKVIAMIPARMGSQRLPKKNLALLDGVPLIAHAIRKCRASGLFDEIWVNSEHPDFGDIARAEGVNFHQRP